MSAASLFHRHRRDVHAAAQSPAVSTVDILSTAIGTNNPSTKPSLESEEMSTEASNGDEPLIGKPMDRRSGNGNAGHISPPLSQNSSSDFTQLVNEELQKETYSSTAASMNRGEGRKSQAAEGGKSHLDTVHGKHIEPYREPSRQSILSNSAASNAAVSSTSSLNLAPGHSYLFNHKQGPNKDPPPQPSPPIATPSKHNKLHSRLFHLIHHEHVHHTPAPPSASSSSNQPISEISEKSKSLLMPLLEIVRKKESPSSENLASFMKMHLQGDASTSKLGSASITNSGTAINSPSSLRSLKQQQHHQQQQQVVEDHATKMAGSNEYFTPHLLSSRSSLSLKKKPSNIIREKPEDEDDFFDKYQFVSNKIIGKGASGVVRLARRPSSSILYAVKEFRKRRKDESYREYIKKLTSEFCIGSMMHHVNVVETVDIVKGKDTWYEVMEYCPGGDLYHIIREGNMDTEEIDCCFRQLIEGVSYLHSLGVAHRDLKPENLLIAEEGHLKITDFGVSDVFRVCWEKKGHLSRGLCGSSPYIAPEEFTGKEYDAQKVDVWACGIIYYAMTFHGIPWEQANSKDPNFKLYMERRGAQYEPLVRLPHGPQQLLARMLEPDPDVRISVTEIMEDPWFKRIVVCVHPNAMPVIHEHKVKAIDKDNMLINT